MCCSEASAPILFLFCFFYFYSCWLYSDNIDYWRRDGGTNYTGTQGHLALFSTDTTGCFTCMIPSNLFFWRDVILSFYRWAYLGLVKLRSLSPKLHSQLMVKLGFELAIVCHLKLTLPQTFSVLLKIRWTGPNEDPEEHDRWDLRQESVDNESHVLNNMSKQLSKCQNSPLGGDCLLGTCMKASAGTSEYTF